MSECFEFSSSMTGSTNSGPLQPQKDSSPLPSSPFHFHSTPKSPSRHNHRQRLPRKMTLTSSNGQPIQLTPLWEHVVRTRKFPSEVDTRLTFLEISERLRDPEWEVRQHALRVLIDVLPTLNVDIVDKVMQPVVPELVNNLGHPAPAVRKGALDALRVFLTHNRDKENTIKRILQDGLNRSEVCDSFQTNVTTGVILSVPSLLFPSSSSPSPSPQLVKDATIALASRLAQVPHQEAVLKSLTKIRDAVGTETFESYLEDYDNKLKKNIEILSKIYNVRSNKRTQKKSIEKVTESKEQDRKWDSDSDTSGIAEEEDEVNTGAMSAARRVVLETEIKFNEETAITMTILEEKDDSEKEQDEESGTDVRNDTEGKNASPDRRKTPRRVHFGGEIVKLRTPDSDETESIETIPKTRIPVPVSPATKMPNARPRPSSQPCSPRREAGKTNRPSRSVSSSPKRDVYTHNAELSPKKSILARTNSPVSMKKSAEQSKKKKNTKDFKQNPETNGERIAISGKPEEAKREDVILVQNARSSNDQNSVIVAKENENRENNKAERIEEEVREERLLEEKRVTVENIQKVDSLFGSPIRCNETEQIRDEVNEDDRSGGKLKSCLTTGSKHDNVDCERTSRGDRDKAAPSVIEKNGNAAGEAEVKSEEPSWEGLGLVDQEVLEDLHNKEDWRARVRGLERVASALRTSSALIAIEPRLGSLLHAVLGCERSCRVAAAGLAVAKIVVAGVSEEALKKQLPQLAWGLARHGGPSATQLARITMLRLRPALLLEQLLQPQCLNARNAKTRENTLQLLIFSLVTFPSTEFKADIIANKVAKMVRDRRRRVRQAALDTLAVLAQIYESEEVLAAGKRASEGYHDAEAMMSAIRARLARKSLPLVSVDGLVMYGLQISPTVQIATGPDVDWIVAGSGSVSPSIGRTKSQIIATRSEKERFARNENANCESPWIERPNFVALGVGMRSKTGPPLVWQMVPTQNQNLGCEDEVNLLETKGATTDIRNGEAFNLDIKSRNQTRIPAYPRESANYRIIVEDKFDRRDVADNSNQELSNVNSRMYPKYTERDKLSKKSDRSKCSCSSSIESHQPSLSKNVQQSFIMHNMYNAVSHRENRFGDENSFRPLQTAPTPLTYPYNTADFNQRTDENNDSNLSRPKFHRRTKDAAAQKITNVEVSSSDAQTSEYFPAICSGTPCRRRLRSLSPSQLYHRQQFVKIYDTDKTVNEEEYNEKNKQHFLSEENYRVAQMNVETQFEGDDYEHSSSDALENNQEDIEQDVQDTREDTDNGSSSSDIQNAESAFDIITGQSSPARDTVDFVITLDKKTETTDEVIITSNEDEPSKEWSSDEEETLKNENQTLSRQLEFHDDDQNESQLSSSDEAERTNTKRRSIVSVLSSERILTNESLQTSNEILHSNFQNVGSSPLRSSASPKKSSRSSSRNSNDFEALKSPGRGSCSSSRKLSFELEDKNFVDSGEEKVVASEMQCEKDSFQTIESGQSRRGSKTGESPTIIIASRPHSSTDVSNYSENHVETTVQIAENNNNPLRFVNESNENNNLEDGQSKDSSSETNTEPGILKIETQPVESINLSKRLPSKVPRATGRYRGISSKRNSDKPEKTKPIVQQCFAHLESKDWEITMKGLKTLSQLAKQQPEYLDVCATATICRLLGRQIKSLRSQVARTACLAAGDIFSSSIRGIDQDFEDIAEPLLHRTADTNRFLRADSNAALDLMIEHLPPHKTIAVIVQRGASHQNAIVRAATARLLASIVDRIGPEHTMILPKDVKDKLLSTGARLLIDGNLDARNHAKKMFRRIMGCEGFRKALTDAVPETTLRHIDKTLKTL
ncbi:TOG array regulator of axonemal microtubules protein 1 isoform X2 [Osmia bicornis bicornis]|uniref:TOG array regulator of axonemal microtubules protein 1 isoform X2 n=1 Tax=Osmia bicornis bicornis TaxID=1437191 RepID=UPI001EAF3C42|nr:TOG array regulator of axonemal microtubules protein 1 isoform X2 [Osmia bicornis bicornis]